MAHMFPPAFRHRLRRIRRMRRFRCGRPDSPGKPGRERSITGKEVKVYFEFDFFNNYDRNSIRLRQFYGQYKNFLAGQAWSAFADPDAFPDTLEFEGPPGIIAARFPQLRYTQPLSKHHSIGVSIENSVVDTPFSTQFAVPNGTSKFQD